jgi:hypothetical protein
MQTTASPMDTHNRIFMPGIEALPAAGVRTTARRIELASEKKFRMESITTSLV